MLTMPFLVTIGKEVKSPVVVVVNHGLKEYDKFPGDNQGGFIPPIIISSSQRCAIHYGNSINPARIIVNGRTQKVSGDGLIVSGKHYSKDGVEIHALD